MWQSKKDLKESMLGNDFPSAGREFHNLVVFEKNEYKWQSIDDVGMAYDPGNLADLTGCISKGTSTRPILAL